MPRKSRNNRWTHRKKRTATSNAHIPRKERQKLAKRRYQLKKKAKALKERSMNDTNNTGEILRLNVHSNNRCVKRIVQKSRRKKRQKLNGIGLLLMAANDMAKEENNNRQNAKEPMKCDHTFCKNEYDADWIQCDKCTRWYHYSCANLTQSAVSKLKEYICPKCV